MNNDILKEVSAKVSEANNVLVAVSSNPTVDQLSAAVGLTLLLNKLGKHATTVFSGVVPSTLEFLQPEQAIEKTTDSLRDFIIALDKSKADKLRYKVEDDVVRIFITPYKTTISDADLNFSLGEFNVDVVIAIGISNRDDVDKAVTSHGRILHDATVVALTNKEKSDFGAVNWNEPQSSSVSEMVSAVAYQLSAENIDGQMATALLTGIIAETDRFRNQSTTPQSLDFASRLMRAGANQQLIADELESAVKLQQVDQITAIDELPKPHDEYEIPKALDHKEDDGSLQINHKAELEGDQSDVDNIHIDHHGNLSSQDEVQDSSAAVDGEDDNTYLQKEDTEDQKVESSFGFGEHDTSDEQNQSAMTHGKTINPLHEPDFPRSPQEPFDAQKAIQAMQEEQGLNQHIPSNDDTQQSTVSEPEQTSEQITQEQPPQVTPEAAMPQEIHEASAQEEQPAPANPVEQVQPAQAEVLPQVSAVPQPLTDGDNQQEIDAQPPKATDTHVQTLQELEQAVGDLQQQQVSSSIPEPVQEEPQQSEAAPQPAQQQPAPQPQQIVDPGNIPTPLTEEQSAGADAPPPVPPPMQPQYFDNNSGQ